MAPFLVGDAQFTAGMPPGRAGWYLAREPPAGDGRVDGRWVSGRSGLGRGFLAIWIWVLTMGLLTVVADR